MHRGLLAVFICLSACRGGPPSRIPEVATSAAPQRAGWPEFEALVDRLSIDLRGHRLSIGERDDLRKRGAIHGTTDAPFHSLYREQMNKWLTRDFYRDLMQGFMGPRPVVSSLFVGPLSRYRLDANTWVYYMPHTVGGRTGEPCDAAHRVSVRPWWAIDREVLVCTDSYRPERVYDAVGFCAGQPEPTVPSPPREGCGCGPLLASCLPPADEHPKLLADLDRDVIAEVTETSAEIAVSRSFDELLTVTSTWQSGLVRFLYLRREMLRDVHGGTWSPQLEATYARRIAEVEVFGPPRWVDRGKDYAGTGLYFFSTPAIEASVATYRVLMRTTLGSFLCTDFESVRVDSHVLLAAVGKDHSAIRALEVHESPMRSQVGCKECHAPLDYGAGFLRQFRTPLFGAYATGLDASGKLYVRSSEDYRGEGQGLNALAKLLVKQPEFPQCATMRLMTRLLGNPTIGIKHSEELARLQSTFESSGRNVDTLVRAIVESKYYTAPVRLDGTKCDKASPGTAVGGEMTSAATIIQKHCASCHDAKHEINLTVPIATLTPETWSRLSKAVETGQMPPEDEPRLNVQERRTIVRASTLSIIGSFPDMETDRWSPSNAQKIASFVRFAQEFVPAEEVKRLLHGSVFDKFTFDASDELQNVLLMSGAFSLCKAVADRQHWTSAQDPRELADFLARRIVGRPASAHERSEAARLIARFSQEPNTATLPPVSYCASYLTSATTQDVVFPSSNAAGESCE